MSTGAAYDIAEIRGRMAVCFSLAELKELAEGLGATDIAYGRGISEAAREICRHFERKGDIGALVARLKDVRPLVEWPEPRPAPPDSTLPSMVHDPLPVPPPSSQDPQDALDEDAEKTLVRPSEALDDEGPAPRAEAQGGAPPAPRAPLAPVVNTAEPPIHDPYASPEGGVHSWPGTVPVQKPEAQPRGLDPRILVAVTGLMVVAVLIAYLAGRVSISPAQPAATAPSAASATPAARRPDGLATRVADAIDRRLTSASRACEIPAGAAPDLMRRAYAKCGREAISGPPRGQPLPPAPPAEPPETPPAAPPPLKPRPVAAPAQPAAASNAGCLGTCERQHKACKSSQCGKEPAEASKYNAYQDCLGKCLVEASKCRLACQ